MLTEYLKPSDRFLVQEFVTPSLAVRADKGSGNPSYSKLTYWYSVHDHRTECRIQTEVAKGTFDLVHFLDGEHGYFYSRHLSKNGHCRLVATYHQPEAVLQRHRLLGSARQLEGLDRAVILCESQRSFFSEFLPNQNIVCIPHGVDTGHYAPARIAKDAPCSLHCLTVGFWLRDLQMIADTASALADCEDIRFTMVGLGAGLENGSVDSKLYRSVQNLPNVDLLDRISDGELLSLYRKADLLFLPLLDCTANNVLLEGIACGLPVLTSDIPGTRFYLTEECACFCPPGDADNFIRKIQGLKIDRERRMDMSKQARNLAESRYGWPRIIEQYTELYRSLLPREHATLPRASKDPFKRAICTVISSDYLHLALALFYSIRKHSDCDFFALVADDHLSQHLFEGVKRRLPPGLYLLRPKDISADPFHHDDEDSLRWALKPSLMRFLLEKCKYDAVIFADSDVCFFEDMAFLFDALRSHSILLTPHWRPIDPHVNEVQFVCNMQHGLFNGGFVGASQGGIEALRWWEKACRYRCEKRVEEGFYVDQKYLDILSVYFDGVKILEHKGCNVAEWNAEYLPRVSLESRAFVENWPVVFIHFTGLTIRRISQGGDPTLIPYLKRYREFLDRAERAIAQHQWHLLEEESPAGSPVNSASPPQIDTTNSFAWCAVVNYLDVPYFLLQLESLRERAKELPRIYVACADVESLCFLKSLNIKDLNLISWQSLRSYRLAKQRQRHEGNDRQFQQIATPFFLHYLFSRLNEKRVLYLANNLVFTARPEAWFSELLKLQGQWLLSCGKETVPHEGQYFSPPLFLWLNGRRSLTMLERWQKWIIRGSEWQQRVKGISASNPTFEENAQMFQDHDGHFALASRYPCFTESASLPPRTIAVLYDDTSLSLQDWDAFPDMPSCSKQTLCPFLQHAFRCLKRLKRRYRFSRTEDLDGILKDIPKRDLARVASLHRIHLKDFGERIREPWGAGLSNTMNAYLLYLTAVNDRQNGSRERALRIFEALMKTETLMPDLYRSKTHHHLAQMAEEAGDLDGAVMHYRECLKRLPHHAESRSRLEALKRQVTSLEEKPQREATACLRFAEG